MGTKTYLMLTCHPDDEVLWASTLPKRYPGIWKCHCLTIPQKNPERIDRFDDACKRIGINQTKRIGKPDKDQFTPTNFDDLYIDTIGIDHIVTHNENGEYGHIHHRQMHEFVLKFTYNKPLTFFGYGSKHKPTIIHNLTEEEQKTKMDALKMYNMIVAGEPYYKGILKWLGTMKDYDFNTETFYGAPL